MTPTLISGYAYECDVETPDGGTRTREDNLNCITPLVNGRHLIHLFILQK